MESDTDDDENESKSNQMAAAASATPGSSSATHLPSHYLTSTPFGGPRGGPLMGLEEGPLVDTPGRERHERHEDDDSERRFLNTSKREEQLEILYEARGHEIDRLRGALDAARDEVGSDGRRARHELAMLKGENEKLNVQLEQAKEIYDGVVEENRTLRGDVELLKAALQKQEKVRDDVSL